MEEEDAQELGINAIMTLLSLGLIASYIFDVNIFCILDLKIILFFLVTA